jgi:hypothetical protein
MRCTWLLPRILSSFAVLRRFAASATQDDGGEDFFTTFEAA